MVHRAREIGVGKRDPAERCIPQNFSRGRFTASAKEESGLRLRGEEGEFVFDACASYNKRAAQGISAGRPIQTRRKANRVPYYQRRSLVAMPNQRFYSYRFLN